MGFNATKGVGKDFEQPNPGNYPAACIQVIDLGMQDKEWAGVKSSSRQCRISWELPGELMEDGKTPFMVSKFYTVSTHEKSNMRPDFESWLGQAFTPEQEACFDLFTVAGKPCLLNCVSKQKTQGGTTIVVAGITPLPAAMVHLVASLYNPIVKFSVDDYNAGDQAAIDTYNGLTDWLKGKINLGGQTHMDVPTDQHPVDVSMQEAIQKTREESENPGEGQEEPNF